MDQRPTVPRRTRGRLGLLAPAPGLVAVAALFTVVSVPAAGRVPFLFIVGFGTLATVFVGRRSGSEDRLFLTNVMLLAVAARLLVMGLIHQTVGPVVFAPDAVDYQRMGTELLRAWTLGAPLPARLTDSVQVGFPYINGVLFLIFGVTPVAPQTLNVFFGTWLAIPLYWITYHVTRRNAAVARWAVVLTLFFPSLVLWSTLNIREAPTILTVALILYFVTRYQVQPAVSDLLGALFFLAVLTLFREYLTLLVGIAVATGIVVGRSRSPLRSLVVGLALLMILTFAAQNLGLGTTLVEEPSLSRVEYLRQDMGYGARSSYGAEYDVSTPAGALRFLPVGLAYFLLAPFPWALGSVLQATTLPEVLLWYALVPFGLWGLFLGIRKDARSYVVIVTVLGLITFAYSLVEGNVGTAYRHRGQVLPLMFVFVALGLRDRWAVRRMRREEAVARRRAVARMRAGPARASKAEDPVS